MERAAEEIRLTNRYFSKPSEAIGPDELAADIDSARMLLENPTSLSAHHPWEVPALVAAAALEAHLLHRVDIPDDALSFATDTVLRVSEGEASPGPYEFEEDVLRERREPQRGACPSAAAYAGCCQFTHSCLTERTGQRLSGAPLLLALR